MKLANTNLSPSEINRERASSAYANTTSESDNSIKLEYNTADSEEEITKNNIESTYEYCINNGIIINEDAMIDGLKSIHEKYENNLDSEDLRKAEYDLIDLYIDKTILPEGFELDYDYIVTYLHEKGKLEMHHEEIETVAETPVVEEKVNDISNMVADGVAKDDSNKLHMSFVPPEIIYAIAKIRDYGNKKYHKPQNWRSVDVERYHEAFLRHVVAAWEDIDSIDPESGMPHLWHAACNLAFILEMKSEGWEEKKIKYADNNKEGKE